jgi:hypothetical protein
MPVPLLTATLRATAALMAGHRAVESVLSPSALVLMEGVLRAMFLTKLKIVTVAALVCCAVGAGLLAYPGRAEQPPGPGAGAAAPAGPPPAAAGAGPVDEEGFPPLAALGEKKVRELLDKSKVSVKLKSLLRERYSAAEDEMTARRREFLVGRGTLDIALGASRRLLEAERELSAKKEDQIAALQNHLKRVTEFDKVNRERYDAGRIPIQDLSQTTFYRVQAEIWLERAREE